MSYGLDSMRPGTQNTGVFFDITFFFSDCHGMCLAWHKQVRSEEFPEGGEPFPELWERVEKAWDRLIDFIDRDEEHVAVVSSHTLILGGLMGCCLGLDKRSIPMFRYC